LAGQEPKNDPNAQNKSLLAADSETDTETRRIQTATVSGKNYVLTQLGSTGVSGGQVDAHPVTSAGVTLVDTQGGQTYVKVGEVARIPLAQGTDAVTVYGSDDGGTTKRVIKTDSGGATQVDIESALPAGTNNIGDVDVLTVPTDPFGANADAASASGSISAKLRGIATALGITAFDLGSGTGGSRTLRSFQDTAQWVGGTGTDSSAVQRVSLATNVALPAGTNGIGKLTANSGVDIGDVDIGGGLIADDATTPGNPIMIGGSAVETDGTDPTSVSAEADVARVRTDRNRRLLVNTFHPNLWTITPAAYSSAQTNASVKAAPGAGLSLYITDIFVSNGATAGIITLLDGSGGTVIFRAYTAINGGAVLNLQTPIRLTANTALCITSTTVTTHSVTISGFTAP